MTTESAYLTAEEVAAELRITAWSVRRLLRAGKLIGVRVGGRWLIGRDQIMLVRALAGASGDMQITDVATMDAGKDSR